MKMLNSGQIPGLMWVDKEKLIFKIPWKHRGKQDWSEDNGLIFKAWALHTGKIGASDDYAKWKTRLRCALHKAEGIIEEKGMNMAEGDEPFRAYRFTRLKTKRKRTSSLNTCNEMTVGRPEFKQSSHSLNYINQFENIPTVVQCINFEDSEELSEADMPHVDSTVEISSDVNEDESVEVCTFTPLQGDLDNGSSYALDDIIGISLEVQFKGQTILKDSFCKNEKVLLKSSCHLYRDRDMTVDKIITIEEKGDNILQDLLRAMAEGLHFLYSEEEMFVKQATRCDVRITYLSPMETSLGVKLADEVTIPFDSRSLIKFEVFQNSSSQLETVHKDGLVILVKPITNEIN